MSEVDEIVARLRRGELAYKSGSTAVYHGPTVFDTKVAATISQLQAEIARYREALNAGRELADCIFGENRPSRFWAKEVRDKIDAALGGSHD